MGLFPSADEDKEQVNGLRATLGGTMEYRKTLDRMTFRESLKKGTKQNEIRS